MAPQPQPQPQPLGSPSLSLPSASLIRQLAGLSDGPASAPGERCALLVSGSPRGAAPSLISQLASMTAFALAVDSGAELMRAAGITPGLVLGDFDSISPGTLDGYRAAGVELVAHNAYKDETDIELALDELWCRGFSHVVATNVLGGRIDHELASLGSLAALAERGASVAVIEDGEACVFLSARGGRAKLGLDSAQGAAFALISLIPWGGEATVSISGAEWELDHTVLVPALSRGVSNVPRAGRVEVEAHAGAVIVVLEFQAEHPEHLGHPGH
jgi:thiamine pyrophosphokinase